MHKIFSTGAKLSYQHFDWLFSLVKKIVLSFCSQHGRRVWIGMKRLFKTIQYIRVFPMKNMKQKEAHLDSVFQRNNEEINCMNLFTQQNLNSYFKKKNTCFKQKIA